MKLTILIASWLLLVGGGMFALAEYKATPGPQAPAPAAWPADSTLQRVPGAPTLVMMSHPRCPCTRASLEELQTLLSQFHDTLTVYILFIQPDGVPYEWTKTDLWQTASRIASHNSSVHVVIDANAAESDRFDGLTSGQIVLYNTDGQLAFNGGITGARGHIGDNLGLTRVLAVLRGKLTDRFDSPVFGCPLHAEESR